jgi:pantoate--beta-alanine ligase
MHVTETVAQARALVSQARSSGQRVGLVPTMGALHAGHVSLLRAARRETGFVVASIFVNPTQFGPNEDLDRYPRPLQHDLELCRAEGVDLVFAPPPAEIYPPGFCTFVEVHGMQDVLEGASRPGHFRGVATVVLKLFNIVVPDVAYFGQKDAQQVRILQKLVADLNVPVSIEVCPTVREPDGLALSSRNQYLDPEQRRHAAGLFRVLEAARQQIESGERDADKITSTIRRQLEAIAGARVDYVAAVSYDTLKPLEKLSGAVLIPIAVYIGATRLIDNIVIALPESLSQRSH